ncbi:MAG: GNAT family N-acetyltransferase, partial [Eubacteriales bacterium]|nr:GNAT family N-acetyltransferase [Eubacteriales bacterium]
TSDIQKVWGEFREGSLTAVLLKYYDNYIFYSNSDFFIQGFASIMISENGRFLSGEIELISRFQEAMKLMPAVSRQFCKLDRQSFVMPDIPINHVKVLTGYESESFINDKLHQIMELLKNIKEFEPFHTYDSLKRRLSEHNSRIFYVKIDEKIVAMAQTTAENPGSAMVVAVCTHPDYRNKGYATVCVAKLCSKLLAEGRILCLIYDNEKAGNIYKKLGFREIGLWSMYDLKKLTQYTIE